MKILTVVFSRLLLKLGNSASIGFIKESVTSQALVYPQFPLNTKQPKHSLKSNNSKVLELKKIN